MGDAAPFWCEVLDFAVLDREDDGSVTPTCAIQAGCRHGY
jgi:hypothetical protein